MRIIKKDGTLQEWNDNKIRVAVSKSAERVMITLYEKDYNVIIEDIKSQLEDLDLEDIPILTIHHVVESALENFNPKIAKSYRDYRNYKQEFVEMLDKVYRKSQQIRYIGDKDNANTDSALVSTKRCLIFNEFNKNLYRKFFMTKDELQACKDGYIYIHDQSARLDTMNCCISDIEEIMRGGFEMGNIFYTEPKTLDVAFDVMSDIILSTASQQYGGYTVPEVDKILSYYAEKSYKIYFNEYLNIINNAGDDRDQVDKDKDADEYAIKKITRDYEQGFQGIEMKLNTVASSRGDYPFISMTFGLATDRLGKLASITFLKVHSEGQGKKGFKKPVLFPKLIFLYDENIHGPGCINEDVFEAGVDCSSKTMYPDWLSLSGEGYVASVYKKYKKVISPMGCVQKDELVTYKLHDNLYVESIGRMWNRLRCIYSQKLQHEGQPHLYMDIDPNVVQIYDKENGFVGTKRMIKNKSDNWVRVTFSNGRILECTTDHPLPVIGKGRTFVKDLKIGDIVPINKSQYVDENFDEITSEFAWALGVIVCDGCYDEQATASVRLDKEIVATYLDPVMKEKYSADMLEHQIPEYIFRSNKEVRLAFLAGMIDADGFINDINHVSIIQFESTNKELALQQMALMQSLGIRASIYSNHYDSSNNTKIRYRVEGEAIHDILPYIKCDKKKNNFKDTERVNSSIYDLDEATVTRIEILENRIDWSYDVTTESDHFDVSGIYSHNCRAFLSPWYERGGMEPADENDVPVFVGRFNIGAVSLNLPMILEKSHHENKDFYETLGYYMEMIRNIHKRTFDYLGELRASVNPVMFCEGGFYGGHLQPHDKIKPLLAPMTASFGITALNELQNLYNGKSIREDNKFALEVMHYINDTLAKYKKEDHILYAVYGTPAESLCLDGDTEVKTSEGFKKIKDIKEGDLVYTLSEVSHKVELKPVLCSKLTKYNADVLDVKFTDGQIITCTPDHPFGVYTVDRRYINWYKASGLLTCDATVSIDEENDIIGIRVDELKHNDNLIDVYNLEIADNHNFFVRGKGNTNNAILVHNCGLQIEQFRKMYGIIEGVSDRPYVSNSFHCHVTEDMTPIEKQDKEGEFWDLFNGGKIQYVRYPISYNTEAIRTLIRRAMKKGFYEGVNLSLAYCDDCGHQELEMDVCPKCGSKNLTKIDRMNGYLSFSRVHGDTRLNAAKMAEISERKSM